MEKPEFLKRPEKPLLGLRPCTTAELVVLGIPYDSSQTYVTGSRFFPFFVRLASESIEEFSWLFCEDVRRCDASDWGDVEVSFGNFEETRRRVKRVVDFFRRKKFVFIGGDHSITIMTVSALKKEVRFYLQLDAHADFEDEYLGFRFGHDSVLRRVGEMLGWDRVALLGVRSFSEKAYKELKELGVEFYTSLDLKSNSDLLRDFVKKADYISLDMDFFDPAYAPEVGNPEPLGIEPLDFFNIIEEIKAKFFDVVEGVPREPGSPTAVLAASILREVIIAMARR